MWTKWSEATNSQHPRSTPVHLKTHHGCVRRFKSIGMQENTIKNKDPYLHHKSSENDF